MYIQLLCGAASVRHQGLRTRLCFGATTRTGIVALQSVTVFALNLSRTRLFFGATTRTGIVALQSVTV